MLRLALALGFLAVCLAAPVPDPALDSYWKTYKIRYGKRYNQNEDNVRRLLWERNLQLIQNHNMEADMGLHTYTLGMNEFGDLTNEEFRRYLKGYRTSNRTKTVSHFLPPNFMDLPPTVDWRTKGYVTPVKNQEQCGSCWAFSATGSLEGQHFKATGNLVSLSEQNLVDCSTAQGNMGCNGGLMDQAFEYVKENNGIDTEASYPYEAKDGQCRFNPANVGATCTGYTDIVSGDENALQQAVATVGPISVAIDASSEQFQLYKSGVYDDPTCGNTPFDLDHGVLAVGYGTQDGQDYWLVKNSWGTSWGMQGYILMSRNKDNQCGIATEASYPLV